MKKQTLGALLGIGASLISGCNAISDKANLKRAYEQTRLCYDPSETPKRAMGIWAVDYKGINRVTLTDENGRILIDENPADQYMKNPTGALININKPLDNGRYVVTVYGGKSHFDKKFTKYNDKISTE